MGAEMSNEVNGGEPRPPPSPPPPRIELPLRDFSLEELRFYDGTHPVPELGGMHAIYLALNFVVYDVTAGKNFYGPGK